jgi:HEPN domain-containing protein
MATLIQKPQTFSSCKKLACMRIEEAKILYENKHYSGAYYLAGYAIELGLKAFFCKKVKKYTFPDKQATNNVYTHDLNNLRKACGLKEEFDKDTRKDSSLVKNWELVKDWNEKSRYSQNKKLDSKDLINSVEVILKWIQTKW